MVADSSVWLVVAPQYLMLLTTCVRPAHGPHNTVTHFYAFPAYIIRKFSPLSLLTTAGDTVWTVTSPALLWSKMKFPYART